MTRAPQKSVVLEAIPFTSWQHSDASQMAVSGQCAGLLYGRAVIDRYR
jgi:hypothetical protein